MDTKVKPVEVLPLVKYYMEQLGLARLFDKFVPNSHGAEVAPAQVLCLLVMNIMVSAKPLYRVEEWLHDYLDGMTEQRVEAAKYNDDRLGRNLDPLFVADRASFLTELSAKAFVVHQLETETIHNDSTSVTFLGAYDAADPKAVKITHGYNKDHRPDCKQIVFGLNITGDGHVPLGYQLYDGNQADVTTHIPNWQHLRELLEREDFIYVADSKLCSEENLKTTADNGARFITVVPRNFREVKDFLERVLKAYRRGDFEALLPKARALPAAVVEARSRPRRATATSRCNWSSARRASRARCPRTCRCRPPPCTGCSPATA